MYKQNVFINHIFKTYIHILALNDIQRLIGYQIKQNSNNGKTICCILTFGPAKHAIPKWCAGRKWHIPMASNRKRSRGLIWLMKWDKVKISWYTHRLMHRKRVTSELHDSYFRLMTIKHAIPNIECALSYYITRSRQEFRELQTREVADKKW